MEGISTEMFTANNIWMMLATMLVFIMHLGFATLESGLTQSKNTVNILFKNTMIVAIGLLTYALCGFGLMYPGEFTILDGVLGFAGSGLYPTEEALADGGIGYYNGQYTFWTDFLFQGMFAATAATIVSGAVAERVKLTSFLIFSVIYVALVYPIAGSWKWGGGWLADLGFYDFAGSTLVHSVGGWAALVAIVLIGPRIGKYRDGKVFPIEGHNLPMAAIGVFLLWFGWFGFNGGSVLSADPALTSKVLVTTCIAASAGLIGAFATSLAMFKSYDLSMILNGILAGLVGITAGADQMSVTDSIYIGLIAGFLIVMAVSLMDKLKLDDPVGAVAVHLVCGVWGTLAVGVFGAMASGEQLMIQLTGVGAYAGFCIVCALLILLPLKFTIGLRVSQKEEEEGLDQHEHKMDAYPDFRN